MPTKKVLGIQNYTDVSDSYISIYESISFEQVHKCILDLVPAIPTSVLDIGAGSGRDAAALAKMGHTVIAIDPCEEFLESAKSMHSSSKIEWVHDSLPNLVSLNTSNHKFRFILCQGVWQHLEENARFSALSKISSLLTDEGLFALALRHGPIGQESHHFSIDMKQTIIDASKLGLHVSRKLENQPSAISGKPNVLWTRLVFIKK